MAPLIIFLNEFLNYFELKEIVELNPNIQKKFAKDF